MTKIDPDLATVAPNLFATGWPIDNTGVEIDTEILAKPRRTGTNLTTFPRRTGKPANVCRVLCERQTSTYSRLEIITTPTQICSEIGSS